MYIYTCVDVMPSCTLKWTSAVFVCIRGCFCLCFAPCPYVWAVRNHVLCLIYLCFSARTWTVLFATCLRPEPIRAHGSCCAVRCERRPSPLFLPAVRSSHSLSLGGSTDSQLLREEDWQLGCGIMRKKWDTPVDVLSLRDVHKLIFARRSKPQSVYLGLFWHWKNLKMSCE